MAQLQSGPAPDSRHSLSLNAEGSIASKDCKPTNTLEPFSTPRRILTGDRFITGRARIWSDHHRCPPQLFSPSHRAMHNGRAHDTCSHQPLIKLPGTGTQVDHVVKLLNKGISRLKKHIAQHHHKTVFFATKPSVHEWAKYRWRRHWLRSTPACPRRRGRRGDDLQRPILDTRIGIKLDRPHTKKLPWN